MVFSVVLTLLLVSCGQKYPKLSGEAAWTALENAHSLYIKGDIDHVNVVSDLRADDHIVGKVKESGIIDNRMYVVIDGEKQFYYKYETSGEIMNRDDIGTTYGYYDMSDNCLGYMQLRFVNGAAIFFFLNPDETPKRYYMDENITTFYNENGVPIATAERVLDNIFTHKFHIEIISLDSGIKIDYIDKLAVCWSAIYEIGREHRYLTR